LGRSESVRLYRLRKIVSDLGKVKGRGTELISLYIPPKRPPHQVVSVLREEYGTASNIKSDQTRTHVQDALVKIMQRLKLYKKTPENGLVIFCGTLQTDGPGSESIFLYEIEPPKPITTFLYRCDDHFHVDILKEMLKEEDLYGIISMDNDEAALALISGNRVEVLETVTSGVPGKHRAGGQSARRFERLRASELNEYYKRVASHAAKAFLEDREVKGLIVSGPGYTKEEFAKGDYLNYMLKRRLLGLVDTNYAGEDGVYETVKKASGLLENVRLTRERKLVQSFLRELNRGGLATYGLRQVIDAIKRGMAETVLVSEGIDKVYIRVEAKDRVVERIVDRADYVRVKQELIGEVCGGGPRNYRLVEQDLVEYLDDLASSSGAKVELISSKSEEGRMLQSFGGIAALLKYKV